MVHVALTKLNVSASKLPFAPPQSVVVDIAVDGDAVSLTENSVDAGGIAATTAIRAQFDGRIYPVDGSTLVNGFAIERLDRHTWRARGIRSGDLIFTAKIRLAPDGMSIYEDSETTVADGTRKPAILVYERQ